MLLKRKATQDPECPPAKMIRDALSQCSQNVIANLPLRENLRKTIRRERRIGLPPNPKSLDELEDLPPKYQLSAKGEQFLLFDSRDDPDFGIGRVIVFSTRRNLEQLAKSDTWFVDGTFKVCPSIFTQLFTILGSVTQPNKGTDHSVLALPLVYALLSSKDSHHYESVFRAVQSGANKLGIPSCEPKRFMSDFEPAIIGACHTVFPQVETNGCFFHLGQNVYRRIQSDKLQSDYTNTEDDTIRSNTHMLLALAFVPVEDIPAAF